MEKLPQDLPEKVSPFEPAAQTEQPRLVKPTSTRIWFFVIMFFIPLFIMIIFAVFLILSGLLSR